LNKFEARTTSSDGFNRQTQRIANKDKQETSYQRKKAHKRNLRKMS